MEEHLLLVAHQQTPDPSLSHRGLQACGTGAESTLPLKGIGKFCMQVSKSKIKISFDCFCQPEDEVYLAPQKLIEVSMMSDKLLICWGWIETVFGGDNLSEMYPLK